MISPLDYSPIQNCLVLTVKADIWALQMTFLERDISREGVEVFHMHLVLISKINSSVSLGQRQSMMCLPPPWKPALGLTLLTKLTQIREPGR